jgi:hypothetical protein
MKGISDMCMRVAKKKPAIRFNKEKLDAFLSSAEGQRALADAAEKTRERVAELERAQRVTPELMRKQITI